MLVAAAGCDLYTIDPPGYPAGAYRLLPVQTDISTLLDVDDEVRRPSMVPCGTTTLPFVARAPIISYTFLITYQIRLLAGNLRATYRSFLRREPS